MKRKLFLLAALLGAAFFFPQNVQGASFSIPHNEPLWPGFSYQAEGCGFDPGDPFRFIDSVILQDAPYYADQPFDNSEWVGDTVAINYTGGVIQGNGCMPPWNYLAWGEGSHNLSVQAPNNGGHWQTVVITIFDTFAHHGVNNGWVDDNYCLFYAPPPTPFTPYIPDGLFRCPDDEDGDGWPSHMEVTIGTDPLHVCPGGWPFGWPPDANNNGAVDTADMAAFTGHFGETIPPSNPQSLPSPAQRFDVAPWVIDSFWGDDYVDTADTSAVSDRFGDSC